MLHEGGGVLVVDGLLEGYFVIPETMIGALQDDLQRAKQEDLAKPASRLYILHSLKTKLKNCLTLDLAGDIETSMPTGLSNKDGCIFFIKTASHIFPDKEAHKRIIYEYILKLEITESNNMEGFQRKLSQKRATIPLRMMNQEINQQPVLMRNQEELHPLQQ
jgi:hypothetical protein